MNAMITLLESKISYERKKEPRKIMFFFGDIESFDVRSINWNIRYNRNNEICRMLIKIFCLIFKGLLQAQDDGGRKLPDFSFSDREMARICENLFCNISAGIFRSFTRARQR